MPSWICIYCGTDVGSVTAEPASRDRVLKEHVERCPKHPLFAARKEIRALEEEIERCPAVGYHTSEKKQHEERE